MILTLAIALQLTVRVPEKPAFIAGTVVRAATNTTIEDATIQAKPVSILDDTEGHQEERTASDSEGKFVVGNLFAGSYVLIVNAPGYATQIYGGRQPGLMALFESTHGAKITESLLSTSAKL